MFKIISVTLDTAVSTWHNLNCSSSLSFTDVINTLLRYRTKYSMVSFYDGVTFSNIWL